MEQIVLKLCDANPKDAEYQRSGCRGLIIREGKILLGHFTKDDTYLIPGGGMEIGESPTSCCIREVEEETGLIVVPVEMIAKITLYYKNLEFPSFFFVCDIVGKGKTNFTAGEAKRGMESCWVTIEEALKIFSTYDLYKGNNDEKYGTYLREFTAISSYMKTH